MNSTPDLIIILLYLLALLAVGYFANKKIKTTQDYSIAGRKLGFPVLLGTLVGTAVGAASTMGKAGKAYETGLALFFATSAYAIGLGLFGFIAPTIRRIGIWTIPDVLVLRYSNRMRIFFAVVMMLAVIALFGGQLIAVGLAVTAVMGNLGVTFNEAVIAAGIIMVIYTTMGGLVAVAYTDLIQTVIMLAGIGILLPVFIITDVGGSTQVVEYLKPEPGMFWGGLTAAYIISIFLIDIPFSLIDPALWQRAAASKDEKTIRRGMFTTAGIYLFWTFIAVFLGVMAAHILPGLPVKDGAADSAIPMLIIHYMPPVLKGLCLAAMMAIMMSTADTALLVAGMTFSRDFVAAIKPDTDDKKLLLYTRLFIIVIGVGGVIFAMNMQGIFDILLLAFAIFVSGGFIPVMAAIYWKKATEAGALSSSILASITVVALYGIKLSGGLPTWIEPIIVSIAVSLILMVGVSLATYKEETATQRLIEKSGDVE